VPARDICYWSAAGRRSAGTIFRSIRGSGTLSGYGMNDDIAGPTPASHQRRPSAGFQLTPDDIKLRMEMPDE